MVICDIGTLRCKLACCCMQEIWTNTAMQTSNVMRTISTCTVPPTLPPSTAPVCARVWLSSLNAARCNARAQRYNSLQFDAIDCTAWVDSAPYQNQTHWESQQNQLYCAALLLSPQYSTLISQRCKPDCDTHWAPVCNTAWPDAHSTNTLTPLWGFPCWTQIVSFLHFCTVRIRWPAVSPTLS